MSKSVKIETLDAGYSSQGVEIRSYLNSSKTLSPYIISNSSDKIAINGKVVDTRSFFLDRENNDILTSEDLISYSQGISKKEIIPNHEIEKRDFGYETSSEISLSRPFYDFPQGSAVDYLFKQEDGSANPELFTLLYPYILDTEGALDPWTYDGVIEPMPIRRWVTRQKDDMSYIARSMRSSLSSAHETQFGTCCIIEQRISLKTLPNQTSPYLEFGDDYNRPDGREVGYFADDPTVFFPFTERTGQEEFAKIIDNEMADSLSESDIVFDEMGKTYISSASGYTFIDRENGTDSIAFLDQKGI